MPWPAILLLSASGILFIICVVFAVYGRRTVASHDVVAANMTSTLVLTTTLFDFDWEIHEHYDHRIENHGKNMRLLQRFFPDYVDRFKNKL